MSGYRQPLPGWRRRQLNALQAERETRKQEVVGNIMAGPGFEDEPDQASPDGIAKALDDDDLPIAQTEHHSIGKDFILAGRAVFTVAGKDQRFTFRVNRKEALPGSRYQTPSYFVSVLNGAGDHPYSYVGILDTRDGAIKLTKGSTFKDDSKAVIALRWTLARVWAGRPLPAPAACYHVGRCGRCGRPLTVPSSILTGFGPDCADMVGVTYVKESTRRGNG